MCSYFICSYISRLNLRDLPPVGSNLCIFFYLPSAVLSFETGWLWMRNSDYKLLINGTMEDITNAAMALHSALVFQRTEQATVFAPIRPFNTARNGRSENLACWGIIATSGWTTHKQMSFRNSLQLKSHCLEKTQSVLCCSAPEITSV